MKKRVIGNPVPEPAQADVVRRGELVYWKSSRLGRFTGSCEPMILVCLVDAGSGHAFARFASNNSAPEHFRILRSYLESWGRPQEIRTGNASPFVGLGRTEKSAASQVVGTNQIQRALHELEIRWSKEDRDEPDKWLLRFLQEAKQRLAPCLRRLQVSTPAEANRYLDQTYLPRWNAENGVPFSEDAHAASLSRKDLNSILSVVALREIDSQNMVHYRLRSYEVSTPTTQPVLKGSLVRIESHLDDTVHFRLEEQKIKVRFVERSGMPPAHANQRKPKKERRTKGPTRGHNRNWMKEFSNWVAPPLWTHMRSQ